MGSGTFDAGWNFLITTFPVKQKNLSFRSHLVASMVGMDVVYTLNSIVCVCSICDCKSNRLKTLNILHALCYSFVGKITE